MPTYSYTTGDAVYWTGTNPDYSAGTGYPPAPLIVSPGIVQATSPNLEILWGDGYAYSVFPPGHSGLSTLSPTDPSAP